jgi:hypothetical protein
MAVTAAALQPFAFVVALFDLFGFFHSELEAANNRYDRNGT